MAYTAEQIKATIELYKKSNYNVKVVSKQTGISNTTICKWISKYLLKTKK